MSNRLLANLQAAEYELRDNLHDHGIGATARAHMERSLCHIREAFIALDGGHARSVAQLVREQESFERLVTAAFRHAERHADTLTPTKL